MKRLVVIISTPIDRNEFWRRIYLQGKEKIKMEKELVPNNTTLANLRGLLREAKKNAASEEAVCVDLRMWHFNTPNIKETIGVYRSGTRDGTSEFKSVKEARSYIDSWKEETDGNNRDKL